MLKTFRFDVPAGSHVYADKAYKDYGMEDVLLEASPIQLSPIRQKHSTRPLPPSIAYVQHDYRKRIETVGSLIERMLPKTIHAVTAAGFEPKVFSVSWPIVSTASRSQLGLTSCHSDKSLKLFTSVDTIRGHSNPVNYLLDGQQRLSTICGAMFWKGRDPKSRWNIAYDLRTERCLFLDPLDDPPPHQLGPIPTIMSLAAK
jgi:hypothetical protein